MSKIETLTPEQESLLPVYRDKWLKIGLSTESADRPLAEEGIREAYKISGLAEPRIVWCASPLVNGLTRFFYQKNLPVRDSVGVSVWDSVWASVWDSVRDSVGASVRDSVWVSVRDSVGDSVWASVRDSVWVSVRDSVGDSVGASVWDSVWASVWDSVGGQHDAPLLGFYDYFSEVCNLKSETRKLSGLWKIAKSAGWFLPHEHICWVSERHNILRRDERGRLHCENDIALAYPDGWGVWAWHGVRVPQEIILHPEKITFQDIVSEQNIETAHVKLERLGLEKFLEQSQPQILHEDIDGSGKPRQLLKINMPHDPDKAVVLVKVTCPSMDRNYLIRVHPNTVSCAEGIARSFGLTEKQYAPLRER